MSRKLLNGWTHFPLSCDATVSVAEVADFTKAFSLWSFLRAGQERYGNMTRVYYREAVGALVVFDMTRLSTFQAVLKWKGDLDSKVTLLQEGTVRDESREEEGRR